MLAGLVPETTRLTISGKKFQNGLISSFAPARGFSHLEASLLLTDGGEA
jgi:hypothetical protein